MISGPKALVTIAFAYSLLSACAYMPVKATFTEAEIPAAPDFANPDLWSALPTRHDSADHIPNDNIFPVVDGQADAAVDVFFIYPTQFFSRSEWNASLDDKKLNATIDARAITHQASVFNGSCRVYVPRYRQATFNAYFSLTNPDAKKAFELAYSDIKAAFEYYLEHYNNGRPIIIAGHSQGTTHAKWLLRDYFDGKPLEDKLVAAYLIGMPVYENDFTQIAPCDSAGQTGCYVSWRSYLEGSEQKPKLIAADRDKIVVHNPLTFSRTTDFISSDHNIGGLDRDANTLIPNACSAQIHEDIVWVSRPDIRGKAFIPENLHPADYNLYWLTIRNNVQMQVNNYLQTHK
ncbi:MAG TPA: DUF3089 domain-containing protein [Chitinophagales bacterium]|nr:DUF3089 domain-containing protein [Chitinophagales bacterium]HNK99027.1 DUF3089 domain-containing protein [Chitinophagales bacterium]